MCLDTCNRAINVFCVTAKCVAQTTSKFARFLSELQLLLSLLFPTCSLTSHYKNNHYASLLVSHTSHQAIGLSLSHTQPNKMWLVVSIAILISTLSTLCATSRRLRQYERP